MILKRWIISIYMCCLVATANAAPFDDATAAYERGDSAQAFKLFRPLAVQGDASAQFNIGLMYHNGQGVTQNYQEALKWWRLAADQGDAMAQFNIGVLYEKGQGVTQDYQEALKCYRPSTQQQGSSSQVSSSLPPT